MNPENTNEALLRRPTGATMTATFNRDGSDSMKTHGRIALAVTSALLCLLVVTAAPSMGQLSGANFVGGPPTRGAVDVRPSRLTFQPGARSNWHSHGNFQIIMAESGAGQTQRRGEAMMELEVGMPIYTPAGVVHWHGAAPDEQLVQLTFSSGQTNWEGPVSDDDYLGR